METPVVVQKAQPEAGAKTIQPDGAPQIQYKIVKVRKPDGTIVKVRRPISAEEASKLAAAPTTKSESTPTAQVSNAVKNTEGSKGTATTTSITTTTFASTSAKVPPTTKTNTAKGTAKSKSAATMIAPAELVTSPAVAPTPLSKTDRTLNTVATGARAYRGLRMLHRGSSHLVKVLAPQWDIGDWEDGDEDFSDDDDDDQDEDEGNDSDDNTDNVDEKNDSDNDVEKQMGDNNQGHQTPNLDEKSAMKGIATAGSRNIATLKTPKPQSELASKKTEPLPKSTSSKTATVINEKEVSPNDSEQGSVQKPVEPAAGGRNLKIRYKDWSRYIIWGIMILFPLLFMIVGILVAVRNRMSTDNRLGAGIDQAITVAVSIWPIIFAAIVAQSLRAYATYRVERGVRLMTLEQLVNSNSVASSIKQPFLLRRFNWITVALLTLWGLSPLATQAMQRMSSEDTANTLTPNKLRYVDTAAENSNYLSANSESFSKVQAEFNRLYSASFLPQFSQLGADAYSNALLPLLNDSAPPGWQNTDPTTRHRMPGYASAYGIPVALIANSSDPYDEFTDDGSIYNITISAAYLSFTCNDLQVINGSQLQSLSLTAGNAQESSLTLAITPMKGETPGTLALASFITLNTTDPDNPTPVNLSAITDANAFTYSYATCNFSQTFVDANVSCAYGVCYTYAVRPSANPPPFVDSGSANWISGLCGTSGTTNYSVSTATDTEQYLGNDGSLDGANRMVNLSSVDIDSFTYNLQFLMNTLWSIGFTPSNLTDLFSNSSSDTFNQDLNPPISYGLGNQIDSNDIYVTKWGWLAALMICSLFLLLAGIFSIWWDARTVSPDVLGFASSVVRKSKYVQLPPVDNAASGAERARALGEVRVMMQDVKPGAPVGRIALGTAHPNAKRLQPGRSYR